jgi:hypothetical protein
MRKLLWIGLGAGALMAVSMVSGGASITVSADCSKITVKGSEDDFRKLMAQHVGPEMQDIGQVLETQGKLPTGLEMFNAIFKPFAPAGCGNFGPQTVVVVGGEMTTMAELAASWDAIVGPMQAEIDATIKAAEQAGDALDEIELPDIPGLPGVEDEPGSWEPPSMGASGGPHLDAAQILFASRSKRSPRGRMGAYYVERNVVTPRSKVKALVGARVVRSTPETDALLRG